MLARLGGCLPVLWFGNVHFFKIVFRQDYEMVLFLSRCVTVTEWPCLDVETIYVQQERPKALLIVPSQLPDIRNCSSFSSNFLQGESKRPGPKS